MITGGCRCGNISYQCEGEPAYVGNCHCLDCQKFSGAPYVCWATFRRDQFILEEGNIKKVSCTPGITRGFCADCGTPIVWFSDEFTNWIDITVGSFDNPMPFRPQGEAFVSRALPWVTLDPEIPHFDRGPVFETLSEVVTQQPTTQTAVQANTQTATQSTTHKERFIVLETETEAEH